MKQPDDHRQPEAPFYSNETGASLLGQQEPSAKLQAVERSFETQSGYLVLIKQLGSRYALSFKRQIGTPPTSSIFLTADEGQRLANIFNLTQRKHLEHSPAVDLQQNISAIRSLQSPRRKRAVVMPTTLFLVSLILSIVLAILAYQLQRGH